MRSLGCVLLILLVVDAAPASTLDYTTFWANLGEAAAEHYVDWGGGYLDVVVKGEFAYAVSFDYGVQIIDCGNPNNPINRGFLSLPNPVACGIRDHYLYVASETSSILVVDVGGHDNPVGIGAVILDDDPADILIHGPWLYVLRVTGHLDVFNLEAPEAPLFVTSRFLAAGFGGSLAMDGDYLFATCGSVVVAVHVAVPAWPAVAGSLDLGVDTYGLDVHNGIALVGGDTETLLIDVLDLGAMQVTSTIDQSGRSVLLTSTGEAWVGQWGSWETGGVRIYDVSSPEAPVWLQDEINGLRGWPEAMIEVQGHVYIAEFTEVLTAEFPALHVFRLGNLPTPTPLATSECGVVHGVVSHESHIYVASGRGMETWDVSVPEDPELVQTVTDADGFFRLADDGDMIISTAFMQSEIFWLQVMTRAPGGMLELNGQLPLQTYPTDLAVSGGLALLRYPQGEGVTFVDISDREAPVEIGGFDPEQPVYGMALHGRTAVFAFTSGLGIYDLSNLASPVQLAAVSFEHGAGGPLEFVERGGSLLLLATVDRSLEIGPCATVYDVTDPTDPILLAVAPQVPGYAIDSVTLVDDVFTVASAQYLTIYDWDDELDQGLFLGRIPLPELDAEFEFARVAITPEAIVVVQYEGDILTFPRPSEGVTWVPETIPAPVNLSLTAAPNPFNPACELRFTLPAASHTVLDVYDLRGRRIRRLFQGKAAAGDYTIRWDGTTDTARPVPAGVFLTRLRTDAGDATVKITLVE